MCPMQLRKEKYLTLENLWEITFWSSTKARTKLDVSHEKRFSGVKGISQNNA